MKNHSIILVMALIAAGGAMAMDTGTITDGTTTLNGGTIYTVSGNVEINAGATSNALTAVAKDGAGGKKVVINIPENCSLTVNGGEASGRSGAGAGILLPADMTLYVTGKGKLVASGGKAAKGGNGSNGGAASYDDTGDNHHKNGSGGSGGDGGGGAGAGIGGTGGKGDTGGKGASATDDWQYSYHGKYFPKDGSDGEPDRNHIHHKLLRAGMRKRYVTTFIIALALFFIILNAMIDNQLNITFVLMIDFAIYILMHLAINHFIRKEEGTPHSI